MVAYDIERMIAEQAGLTKYHHFIRWYCRVLSVGQENTCCNIQQQCVKCVMISDYKSDINIENREDVCF